MSNLFSDYESLDELKELPIGDLASAKSHLYL